jgi:hypothetical protein
LILNTLEKEKCWCFLYHHDNQEEWSLPRGFAHELEKGGINVKRLEFNDPKDFKLPNKKFLITNNISVLLIFYAGSSSNLDYQLPLFKKKYPEVIIINELGDEPQTQKYNMIRVQNSHISLSPDYESVLYWKDKGFNCHWFTHWADEKIFYNTKKTKREILIGTTMGRRKYGLMLKIIFLGNFQNKLLIDEENTLFYNNVNIAFQYARYSEITRRIFEAAACGCCVLTNSIPKSKRLEKLFKHNHNIIIYRNRFSLIIELIKLVMNKNKIKNIAKNGYDIVIREHTAKARVKYLIDEVNNLKKII